MKKHLLFFIAFILCCQVFSQNEKAYKNNDSIISEALNKVSADSLFHYMEHLESYGTRFMLHPNRKDIALWIADKFMSFGIQEVRLDSFLCHTIGSNIDTLTWQYNVEARIQGLTYPEHEMIVMGHYDSFTSAWDGSNHIVSAPGANDNASGTAAVIECARVFMEMAYQPEKTMIFLATAAEELMYFGGSGSKHYAQEAHAANRKIGMLINNDMIAWNDGSWTLSVINDPHSQHITNLTIDALDNYSSLNYVMAQNFYTYADLEPFLELGFHGVYFMENYQPVFYPYYHTADDVVDNIDTAYHAEITRLNIALMMKYDKFLKDGAIEAVYGIPNASCSDVLKPEVIVRNYGAQPITSMTVVSVVNVTDSVSHTWTGHLEFLEELPIELPLLPFTLLSQNEIVITLTDVNGDDDELPQNNSIAKSFGTALTTPHEIYLRLRLDGNPEETSWDVRNASDSIVFSGGPYNTPNTTIFDTLAFIEDGCYTFSIYDAGNNGLQPPGLVRLYCGTNTNILIAYSFGSRLQTQFVVDGAQSVEKLDQTAFLEIFPNPTKDIIEIHFSEDNYEVLLLNILGQLLLRENNAKSLNLGGLPSGTYLLRVQGKKHTAQRKVIVY